jgi:hypothetical protein
MGVECFITLPSLKIRSPVCPDKSAPVQTKIVTFYPGFRCMVPAGPGSIILLIQVSIFFETVTVIFSRKNRCEAVAGKCPPRVPDRFSHEFNILFLLIFYKSGDWHILLFDLYDRDPW